MIVSGMSGNEVFCLAQKGYTPHELVVGNSVCSLGLVGGLGAWGTGITGGEITNVTKLISEGRHQAIDRMEKEAEKHGASGVTSVFSELRTMAGYTEFLAQGTAIFGARAGHGRVFSTAASGMELFCHLDAGYEPRRFAMGNVAYALGIGQGLMGSVRTMARGEVKEFSQMYNHIRHLALERLREEAFRDGANAVVDVKVRMLPYGVGATELLMTGTASHHAKLGAPANAAGVVTSELTGEELWNLAKLGFVPVQLVMATSVFSLGVVGGIGAMFKGMSRGELPELTSLVYNARENCINVLGEEARKCGAEQVIGNKLTIRELSPGLLEVVAIGTAVKRVAGFEPASPTLLPQAIIVERDSIEELVARNDNSPTAMTRESVRSAMRARQAGSQVVGCVIALIAIFFAMFASLVGILAGAAGGHH